VFSVSRLSLRFKGEKSFEQRRSLSSHPTLKYKIFRWRVRWQTSELVLPIGG
jgi:hypothetical protein